MSGPLQGMGIVFDKDGTLFDFRATWDTWAAGLIDDLSGGDPGLRQRLAAAARFDLEAGQFAADSPIIAGTHMEASEVLATVLGIEDVLAFDAELAKRAADAPLVPAVDLPACLGALRGQGAALAVMTNDAEEVGRTHIRRAGIETYFDVILGADSGYGGKPAPEPLLAAMRAMGTQADRSVMVGDSTHDLFAGRAAAMTTVGVLTGTATQTDLAPYAAVVLPDIGGLLDWMLAR